MLNQLDSVVTIQSPVKQMKLTMISIVAELSGMSARVISSYVRELGHNTQIIFIPCTIERRDFTQATLDALTDRLADSDFIGITLMTPMYAMCANLTRAIKEKCDGKVIWGGIHPTVKPAECLDHADYACKGEGEIVIKSLLEGKDPSDIPGLWYKDDNGKT